MHTVTEYRPTSTLLRGTYRVTADATLSSNETDIIIWPPLESDVANAVVVNFIGSTLDVELEEILVDLTAAQCMISKGNLHVNTVNTAGTGVTSTYRETGERKLALILSQLRASTKPRPSRTYSIY